MSTPVSGLPVGRSLCYLIIAGVAWGTAGAAASMVFEICDLGPLALSFRRCAGGLVLLLAALVLRPRRAAPAAESARRRLLRVVGTGAGLAVFQTAYFAASRPPDSRSGPSSPSGPVPSSSPSAPG